tara:strand:- start:20296 stop:20697 length:402 start_codon:yes stop_codon:yes gene_type:complete
MSTVSNADKYYWFIDGERIGVVETRTEGSADANTDPHWQSPTTTSAGKTLRLHYTSKPTPFTTDLTKSSELPSQFHEALVFKVLGELYKLPGDGMNLQMAQYFDQQYGLAVREAKKYKRTHHTQGGVITPYDF